MYIVNALNAHNITIHSSYNSVYRRLRLATALHVRGKFRLNVVMAQQAKALQKITWAVILYSIYLQSANIFEAC